MGNTNTIKYQTIIKRHSVERIPVQTSNSSLTHVLDSNVVRFTDYEIYHKDKEIKCLSLKHDKALCRAVAKCNYKEEIDIIVAHPQRNKLITNLAKAQKGNTLVLYNYVEKHGKPLYEMIKKACPDRDVLFVSGDVKADERNEIRALTEKGDGTIIVASLGTFSTGISIKNLHNIIFASPSKSTIKVLQSIGRGLRKAKNGQGTVLYDLTDDFRHGKIENFTFKHGRHRIGIYDKQKFDYSFVELDLPYEG